MDYIGPRHFQYDSEYVQTLVMVRCASCPPNMYTLATGSYEIYKDTNGTRKFGKGKARLMRKKKPEDLQTIGQCLACPSGGICNGDLKPIDNNWGHMVSQTEMRLLLLFIIVIGR